VAQDFFLGPFLRGRADGCASVVEFHKQVLACATVRPRSEATGEKGFDKD
jgi:hypothetical protein